MRAGLKGNRVEDRIENGLCFFISCFFLFFFWFSAVEMTKQLTGRTTMTTSGFEALLSILTLLPERCHRRQSRVPEA